MKNSYSLTFILFALSLLFSNNSYLDNYNNNIRLSMDPFNINTYVIDKFFPTHNLDINYYSIRFDGSTFIPLNQSMPKRLSFDYNSNDDFTQLSYNQNKADSYFDTNISMKNNIDDNVDYLLQIESKSLVQNINQNLFFNYSKTEGFFDFNISYMYHYETNSENFKVINYDYINSNLDNVEVPEIYDKSIESYNAGFSIKYINKRVKFISDISNQISSNNRPNYIPGAIYSQIDYDSNVFGNNNLLTLSFNNKSSIYIGNRYKKNIIELDGSTDDFLNQNIGTFGYSYNDNKFRLDIGVNHLDKRVFPLFSTSYNADMFSIKFSVDNQYLNNFIDSESFFGENISYLATRTNLNSYFKLYDIENTIDIGNISYDNYEYNYLLLNGNLKFKKIIFNYKHFSYFPIEDTMIPFKQYSDLNISLYPFKETYEFELYGKLGVSLFNMDSNMDLRKLNPFSTENIEFRDISSSYGEIGIIFDSFMISYKSDNILNREIIYSDLIQSFERYDYISIIWTFKE